MTINFFPSYAIANEGCFYWGWFVACEMQIMFFTPLIVALVYKMNLKWKIGILALLTNVGAIVNFFVIWNNNLAVGLFAPQDIFIFKLFVNKPYTKICGVTLGIALAFIFREINRQKELP